MANVLVSRIDRIEHRQDGGFYHPVQHWCHVVSFSTKFGEEWVLKHTFDDSDNGYESAQSVAVKIQEQISEKGIESLNRDLWNIRNIFDNTDENSVDLN